MLKHTEEFYKYTINIYTQTPDKDWIDFYNMSEEQQELNDQFAPTESRGEFRYEIVLDTQQNKNRFMLLASDDIGMGDISSALLNARWDIIAVYEKAITDEKKLAEMWDNRWNGLKELEIANTI